MRAIQRTTRSAFSLLEMVLAISLAMILLLALYLTLNTYISSAKIGRDTLNEGEVARSIMSRIANDVSNHLGAYDTRALPDFTGQATATTTLPTNTGVPFNIGVEGDATSLRLSVYRVEKGPTGLVDAKGAMETKSDLRRINYWVVMNGGETVGLARREIKLATSQDIEVVAGDLSEQEQYLITRQNEIKSVTFEYFDGSAWQETWDGAASGNGANTPVGPPAAIKITVVLRQAQKAGAPPVESAEVDQRLTFSHVVHLHAGNNFSKAQ